MINIEITPELFENSTPEIDCDCIIANGLREKFPTLWFKVKPSDNELGTIRVYSQDFSDDISLYSYPASIARFDMTNEQNKLACDFDEGEDVIGEILVVADFQQEILEALINQ